VFQLLLTTNVVPNSPTLAIVMMEAICTSETYVLTTATWCDIPEAGILQASLCLLRCEPPSIVESDLCRSTPRGTICYSILLAHALRPRTFQERGISYRCHMETAWLRIEIDGVFRRITVLPKCVSLSPLLL
jgi:hypothetical protein